MLTPLPLAAKPLFGEHPMRIPSTHLRSALPSPSPTSPSPTARECAFALALADLALAEVLPYGQADPASGPMLCSSRTAGGEEGGDHRDVRSEVQTRRGGSTGRGRTARLFWSMGQ